MKKAYVFKRIFCAILVSTVLAASVAPLFSTKASAYGYNLYDDPYYDPYSPYGRIEGLYDPYDSNDDNNPFAGKMTNLKDVGNNSDFTNYKGPIPVNTYSIFNAYMYDSDIFKKLPLTEDNKDYLNTPLEGDTSSFGDLVTKGIKYYFYPVRSYEQFVELYVGENADEEMLTEAKIWYDESQPTSYLAYRSTKDGVEIVNWGMSYVYDEEKDPHLVNGRQLVSHQNDRDCLFYEDSLPSEIDGKPVVGIGTSAFADTNFITATMLPDSLKYIGVNGFSACHSISLSDERSLAGIILNPQIEHIYDSAFYGTDATVCSREMAETIQELIQSDPDNLGDTLTTLAFELPNVTHIDEKAFASTTFLGNLVVPKLTFLGDNAFKDCSSLVSIEFGNDITEIPSFAFSGDSHLSNIKSTDTIKTIGKYAFAQTALKSIKFDNVVAVDDFAFSKCTHLEEASLDNVITIGNNVFADCILQRFEALKLESLGDSVFAVTAGTTTTPSPVAPVLIEVNVPNIKSIGANTFSGCTKLTSVNIGDKLTEIPAKLFYNCTSLETISGLDNVTTIGAYAFARTKIKEVLWPNLETLDEGAFWKCTNLVDVNIGETITEIPAYAFDGCTALTVISLPNTVTSIGDGAFSNTAIESIDLTNITTTGTGCFAGDNKLSNVVFGENMKYITVDMFKDCKLLTEIDLPDSVTSVHSTSFANVPIVSFKANGISSIPYNMFKNSRTIKMIETNGVTRIDEYAFYNCSSLEKASFGKVTNIGQYAFFRCSKLSEMSSLSSVQSIGTYAFYNTKITEANLSGLYSVGDYAFSDCPQLTDMTIGNRVTTIPVAFAKGCNKLSNVTIGKNVTEIKDSAFYSCFPLSQITLPKALTSIGKNAFSSTSLKAIDIPDSVTTIGDEVFSYCPDLETVDYSNSLISIPNGTFCDCKKLISITNMDSVSSIGNSAFSGCLSLPELSFITALSFIGNRAFYNTVNLSKVSMVGYRILSNSGSYADNMFQNGSPDLTIYLDDGDSGTYKWFVARKYMPNEAAESIDYNIVFTENYTDSQLKDESQATSSSPYYVSVDSEDKPYDATFEFRVNTNGTISITDIRDIKTEDGTVRVPATFRGKKVTTLALTNSKTYHGKNIVLPETVTDVGVSFSGNKDLVSINLDYVRNIKANAFQGCILLGSDIMLTNATNIGNFAFAESGVVSVTFGDKLTTMGSSAFKDCTSLVVVNNCNVDTIPQNAFSGTTALDTFEMGSGVTTINQKAFSGSGIKTLNQSEPVKLVSLGTSAFVDCKNLSGIKFADNVSFSNTVFSGCESLKHVDINSCKEDVVLFRNHYVRNSGGLSDAFADSGLESVTLGESVQSIAPNAFKNCKNLKDINLSCVKVICSGAFANTSLESLDLGENVTISNDAFVNCHLGTMMLSSCYVGNAIFQDASIDNLIIGSDINSDQWFGVGSSIPHLSSFLDGATMIGSVKFTEDCSYDIAGAFEGTKIKSIVVPTNIHLGHISFFQNCDILETAVICSPLTNDDSGESFDSARYLFDGCSSLKSVTFNTSISDFGEKIFNGCSNLETIIVPEGTVINHIGGYAFSGCNKLTDISWIDFDRNNTTLEAHAFDGSSIKEVRVYGNKPKAVDAFKNCDIVVVGDAHGTWFEDYCLSRDIKYRVEGETELASKPKAAPKSIFVKPVDTTVESKSDTTFVPKATMENQTPILVDSLEPNDSTTKAVDDTTDNTTKAIDDTTDSTTKAIDDTTDSTTKAVDDTTDSTTKAVDDTTDVIMVGVSDSNDATPIIKKEAFTPIDESADADTSVNDSNKDITLDVYERDTLPLGFAAVVDENTDSTTVETNDVVPVGASVTVQLSGDADGDGELTAADALAILRSSIDGSADDMLDVDGDGNVTAADALIILRRSIGLFD